MHFLLFIKRYAYIPPGWLVFSARGIFSFFCHMACGFFYFLADSTPNASKNKKPFSPLTLSRGLQVRFFFIQVRKPRARNKGENLPLYATF